METRVYTEENDIPVAAASLLPLITAALERWQTVLYDNSFYINQKIYANKLLDMDFPRLDDPKTHDDLSQILQNENWSGYGLWRVLDVETNLPKSVFGVLGVIALTVTLFTQRVPESAGAWTVLNHPLVLIGCVLLLALLSVLPSLCMNRASMLTAELAPLARLGNRFFSFFSFMALTDRDRASDIRMYNQQDICDSYASSDTPFSPDGPFAKLAWGRGGVLMIANASFSVLFTAVAYLFVCLKALAGAFGAGSVVLKNLPANATAVGVPAEIVRVGNIKCCPADDLDQQDLPDIVNQRISELEARLSRLETEKQGEFPPDKKE